MDDTAPTTHHTPRSGGGTGGPLVVACLRVVDLRPVVDPLDGTVTRDGISVELSAADAAALEHAFRLADAWSGHVLAVAAGTPMVEDVLRQALSLGASVVRVPLDPPDGTRQQADELVADERDLARAVAGAVAPYGTPTVVLCGDRSADRGTGAFPAYLAHELGAAQALGLVSLAPGSGGDELAADRRLDGGWREQLRVPCPCVCSVEGAGVQLRRASLPGALAAARAPVPVAGVGPQPPDGHGSSNGPGRSAVVAGTPAPFRPRTHLLPAPAGDDPRLRLLALTGALIDHDPPTVVGPVDAAEAADALLAYLERHGYLADADADAEADADGEPGDGEPGDGEPGDGEPGDGEPGDGGTTDGKRSELPGSPGGARPGSGTSPAPGAQA